MKRILILLAVVSAFVIVTCATAAGQGATAQISGTVKDQSGAVLPGAEITKTQTETGAGRMALSDETGSYVLPNLPVGPYKLEVSLPGFRTFLQSGIVLQVNSSTVVNPVLNVGQVSETVEVQANASLVETRSTGIGQVVENARILELPLIGRQVTDLISINGAALPVLTTDTTFRGSYPNTTAFSIAGGVIGGNSYTLDGGMHNDVYANYGLPLPFPDALQEFKVETSSLPAQYGFHSGGAVNAVTRSGTNDYHGAAFEFVRNYKFNGRNFFAPVRDSLKRNQFGGTFGGPIQKNKLFFFAGYQGTYETVAPAANIAFVPTAATLRGDFTQIASAACNNGVAKNLTAPFSGNQVPQSALNPVALKYLALIPVSSDPCGKYVYGIPSSNHEHQIVARTDWQINDKHSLYARYFLTDYQHPQVVTDSLLTTTTDASVGLDDTVQTGVNGHTFVINSHAVNTLRASATR